jgi:hypothetical protein
MHVVFSIVFVICHVVVAYVFQVWLCLCLNPEFLEYWIAIHVIGCWMVVA